ncbi:MAG: transglycosylase domain-containing protein [Actinomycetaceae bacterium]|nr:transglycosylase domain-containing protein [Actinomycetaceae bacterium]
MSGGTPVSRRQRRGAPQGASARAQAGGRPGSRPGTNRGGRPPVRRKTHRVRGFFIGLGLFFLACIAAGLAVFIFAYNTISVPEPDEFAQAQTTTVYYADGQTKMGSFAEVNRTIIDASTLPKFVGDAVVASEDRTFWTNAGVDLKGIARAFINNLSGGKRQGASTLSQQYVDTYYLSSKGDKNIVQQYWEKAKEAILALKINQSQSKEEILGNYLNTIYFGRGSYGIEAAARAYFDVPAKDLNPSQAAMLAGLIPAPSLYDPAVNLEASKARWDRVFSIMVEDGAISAQERAGHQFPDTVQKTVSDLYAGSQGYLLQHVRHELQDMAGITEQQIDTLGLKIVTTIDKAKMDMMVKAVSEVPQGHAENLNIAMVSLDTKTGGIIAEYGGADYLKVQRNAVTQDIAMAGSTFKPFALIAGLEKGKTLRSRYNGNSPITIGGRKFQNHSNVSYGTVDLATATKHSVNTAYLELNMDVGPAYTKEVAIRAGYPPDTQGLEDNIANVLGTSSPHSIDIATAFNTIATGGIRRETHIVAEVLDSTGDTVYMPSSTADQVFDAKIISDVTAAMEQVVQGGSGKKAMALGRPAAAKTGSSENNRSSQFVGFIPQMVTVVSMYQVGADGSEESITPWGGEREITGSTWPAWLWTRYMKQAVKDLPVEKFPTPRKAIPVETEPSEEPTTSESPVDGVPSVVPSEGVQLPGQGTSPSGNLPGQGGQPGQIQPPTTGLPGQPVQPVQPGQPNQPVQPAPNPQPGQVQPAPNPQPGQEGNQGAGQVQPGQAVAGTG